MAKRKAKSSDLFNGVKGNDILNLVRLMQDKADASLLEFLLHRGVPFLESVGSSGKERVGDKDWQDDIIDQEIPQGASILDLGCGEGKLLTRMAERKNARVQGVELDAANVEICVGKGVPVIQADLDKGLKVFPDDGFDYVILEETLQKLHRPAEIIKEMRRVGKLCIVTFPNFGFWRVRMDLAVRGRMPVSDWLPHQWYNTPNIHLFTIADFIDYAEMEGMKIKSISVLRDGQSHPFQSTDNLYAEEAMVVFD